jgi:hypothetical protein
MNTKSYDLDVWGLSASDGADGYKGYGVPPGIAVHDGTIAPAASAYHCIHTWTLTSGVANDVYTLW